ncbi:hypothetical protein ON010_g14848 [Phytophthora cinnamomi]|nr:hypothetical protein ON010_g14848 [Phytophthora cinnamomi]
MDNIIALATPALVEGYTVQPSPPAATLKTRLRPPKWSPWLIALLRRSAMLVGDVPDRSERVDTFVQRGAPLGRPLR